MQRAIMPYETKGVLRQGKSAEKEFLRTKCYNNLREEYGMSFTQGETYLRVVRSKSDQLEQTLRPRAIRERGRL